jgi:hypothetical protein
LEEIQPRELRKFIKFLPRVGLVAAVSRLYFLHCKFAELDFSIFFIQTGTLTKEMSLSSSTPSAERRFVAPSHLQSENEMKTFRSTRGRLLQINISHTAPWQNGFREVSVYQLNATGTRRSGKLLQPTEHCHFSV